MNIMYITRHFNHSGYAILQTFIERNIQIKCIVLHKSKASSQRAIEHLASVLLYKLKCFWYRCSPLKNMNREISLAKKNSIPILYLDSIKSDKAYAEIKLLNPDLIVLGGGWHELLPERIFALPALGCINTHPSLLPEFRGTSVHRWQILKGVGRSGVTVHYVNSRFDAGEILASEAVEVDQNTTPQELFFKIAQVAARVMPGLIAEFAAHGHKPTISREGNPEFCQLLFKVVVGRKKLVHKLELASTRHTFSCSREHTGKLRIRRPLVYLQRQKIYIERKQKYMKRAKSA